MHLQKPLGFAAALLSVAGLAVLPGTAGAVDGDGLVPLGQYDSGSGDTGAEIVAHDPASQRIFVTNAAELAFDIVDISDPAQPVLVTRVDVSAYGTDIQSLAVGGGVVAVALDNEDEITIGQAQVTTRFDGNVAVFDTDGLHQATYPVGNLPDALAFTPDHTKIVVANEGEPVCANVDTSDNDDEYLVQDAEGTVSIIDLQAGTVAHADFNAWDGMEDDLRADGVRIFYPYNGGTYTTSMDVEPEYPTVSADGATAYVTLQENNAVAVVDIATASVTDILPLGYKDHSIEGNGLDPSDRDDPNDLGADDAEYPNIGPWKVMGMYLPDTIASTSIAGTDYLLTANEGDAREYECAHNDDARVKDLVDDLPGATGFDPTVYPDIGGEPIDEDHLLGRLKTTLNFPYAESNNGDISQIYSLGARSFSIWTTAGALVFDSGDDFAQQLIGTSYFNLDETLVDGRSDDKGAEPEAIAVGHAEGRTFAFVGLERSGGVMMYDITDPASSEFITYVNTDGLSPSRLTAVPAADDVSPESIQFISAADSPTGAPMLAVAYEVSGTTRLFEVEVARAATPTTAAPTSLAPTTAAPTSVAPETTPTTSATPTTAPVVVTTTTEPGVAAPQPTNPAELPATGSSETYTILLAAALLGLGTLAVRTARRPG